MYCSNTFILEEDKAWGFSSSSSDGVDEIHTPLSEFLANDGFESDLGVDFSEVLGELKKTLCLFRYIKRIPSTSGLASNGLKLRTCLQKSEYWVLCKAKLVSSSRNMIYSKFYISGSYS